VPHYTSKDSWNLAQPTNFKTSKSLVEYIFSDLPR
jgi:hypothetical protein